MNFAELRTEVQDLGFQDVDVSRVENWVNQSYLEVCDAERWPFLLTSTTGAPPLTISDLGQVEAVRNNQTGVYLPHEYRETIIRRGLGPQATGTSTRYFLTAGTTVNVWPVGTGQDIIVYYFKVPAVLTGTDTPLLPARYHDLIVAGAARRAYLYAGKRAEAQDAEAELQLGIARMRGALLRYHDPDPDREEA